MRDLFKVVEQILSLVPEDKTDFIQSLNSIRTSVAVAAPEMMQFWWNSCAAVLEEYISEEYDWEKEIIKIWQDEPEKPMKVSDYYPEETAVGPHKKFMMFFTDNKAPWEGGNVEFGLEFIGCTMLCSTYNNMKRVLSTRPEVLEFREKWNKEITPEDLESFIKWYVKEVQKPDVSMSPYDDIFSAIALALDPFYETDKLAKEYIDMLAKCKGGKMKWIAGEIVKAHTQ